MSKVVVVEQDAPSVVEVSTPGPQGPAWPSEVVKAASEAARDAAQAAAQAAAASSASAGGYRDAAGDSAAVAEVASTNAATSAGTASTKASEAAASATAAADSATAAAADRTQTGLDRVQTGLDRAATGQDVATATTQAGIATTKAGEASASATAAAGSASTASTQAGNAATSATAAAGSATAAAGSASTATTKAAEAAASAATANTKAGEASGSAASALAIYGNTAAMNTAVTTATTQAAAAAASAASAASVLQQDLSAVSAALHRSPNAITAMAIYDTSKDSDGGAWVEKCQHTSWFNEPLNGSWLGACASESAARAVSGAATGSYFQLTTDGQFYKLNAGSGTTEVFRGNKAKFPRLAGIVAEVISNNFCRYTIYDLTEAGRPMWMASVKATNSGKLSLHMLNGLLLIGDSGTNGWGHSGFIINDFPKAKQRRSVTNGSTTAWVAIKDNFVSTTDYSTEPQFLGNTRREYILPNTTVNAVAMTVLPDAPTDVVTGLKVPTIAVATAGGVSVIKHDGTVVSSNGNTASVSITDKFRLVYGYMPGAYSGFQSVSLLNIQAGFVGVYNHTNDPGPECSAATKPAGKSLVSYGGIGVSLKRENPSTALLGYQANALMTPSAITAFAVSNYATGWMPGNIRRCYLADTVVESVSNPATQPDRSYKAAAATVYGTLTKSVVAPGAQLVAYSGFSS